MNEQFWVIRGVSAHLLAVLHGLLKAVAGVDTSNNAISLWDDKGELMLVPPITLLVLNVIGVVAGISNAFSNGYESLGPLLGKLLFALWVIAHLYPLLVRNRTPTIVLLWSILVASIFSLIWVRIDPFLNKPDGPVLQECGLDCN